MGRNIVQELCEALDDLGDILEALKSAKGQCAIDLIYSAHKIRLAALAKAGFNEGGAR